MRTAWNKGLTKEICPQLSRNEETREKISVSSKGCTRNLTSEGRAILAEGLRQRRLGKPSPRKGHKMSEQQRIKMITDRNTPEARKLQSERSCVLWQNQDYIRKVYKGLNARPTKPEEKLITVFNKHLPELQYNGDFRLGVSLARLIPDFININGIKEVVEVFSVRFHIGNVPDNLKEETRVERYNKLGYKCLILWAKDIIQMSEEEILAKVNSFRRRE